MEPGINTFADLIPDHLPEQARNAHRLIKDLMEEIAPTNRIKSLNHLS